MTSPMRPKLVLFPHVGRTGGDYLINSITRIIGPHLAQHFDTKQAAWEYLGKVPYETLCSISFMSGHGIYYGIHEQIRRPTTYSVLFRDPVDRVISQYHAYMTDPSYALHESFSKSGITLEQFALTDRNEHACYILGYSTYRAKLPELCDLNETIDLLEREYSFVGTTENWYYSFYFMAQLLGISKAPLLGKRRANEKRPALDEVPDSTRQYIAELNELDIALYQYAQARLDRQIEPLTEEQRSQAHEWKHTFEAATELARDLDPDLFDHACLEDCFSTQEKKILVFDALETDRDLAKKAAVLFEVLNDKYACKINLASMVTVETSDPPKVQQQLSRLNIEKIREEVDVIVIIAKAGESYRIRNPLLEAGIPKSRIRCLFREVI